MMRNTSRGANLHVGLVVVLSQQIKMEDYTNGAAEQYSEEQPAYQEQTYQQPNESGDGGRRFGRDDDEKKLFVGGLSVNTTEGDLRAHFSQFGKIANCILKTDNITGRSRCFGFVVYENKEDLEEALKIEKKQHVINDKEVDPKRANPREAGGAGGTGVKKIFVGGVPHHVDETQIRAAFSQHGNVESVDLPTDKKDDGSEVRKGFIFVSFDSEEDVAALVQLGTVELGGKSCDVREATPKQQRHDRGGFGGRGGRGGARGGGRGGFGGYGPNYNEQWGQGGQWGGPGGQYGGQGCDYSAYNGNYGYDYNNGYAGWGGWGPGGYSDPNYGYGYGGPAYGYPGYGYGDYSQSGWGGYGGYYGSEGGEQQQQQQQQQQPQQQSSGGNTGGTAGYKARGGATAAANKGYHPYSR